ncbi:MAG: HAD-IIA family hydrolase [Clostridium lundense]|nr:HAD-IIA family hydrolase [Clostridium lundense]
MKAIILAAGIGSRLRPITNEKPKTLVKVNNKAILGNLIDALIYSGITNIVLCIGYCHSQIINYCKLHYPNIYFEFIWNKEFDVTNNMYSLYLAKDYLDEDIVLMNADLVIDKEIMYELIQHQCTSVAVEKNRYIDESMKISVFNGDINAISKSIPREDAYGTSIDIYKILKEDLDVLKTELIKIIEKDSRRNEWTEVLLNQLFSSKKIIAKPYNINSKKWCEIDNFQDLNAAEILFSTKINQIKNKKVFFLDIDGTLALGNTLIDGTKEFIYELTNKERKIFIVTNNSSKTPKQHLQKLMNLGFEVSEDNILVSTDSALEYLKRKNIQKVYWIANESVSDYLNSKGLIFDDVSPQVLLLTYDTEINYSKILKFIKFLDKGIPYFATHEDLVCPTETYNIPDIGTFINLIKTTTNVLPNKIFGKPNKSFIDGTLKKNKFTYDDAVVIGDRLYTDIQLAVDSGITSILVLSGDTKREEYENSKIEADIIVNSVKDLIQYI